MSKPDLTLTLSKIILVISGPLCGAACSSTPAWIHALPEGAPSASLAVLSGIWERPVKSRYGVGNDEAHSVGRETLAIDANTGGISGRGRYEKLHVYRELVGGMRRTRFYRETGSLERRGVWVLTKPEAAWFFEEETESAMPALNIQIPNVRNLAAQAEEAFAPGALLFHYEAPREDPAPHYENLEPLPARLTPLTYDHFGVLYEQGLYEGAEDAYDGASENFRNALIVWNEKRFHSHGYLKKD